MPAKPATTFTWATGGGALKTDPGAPQKAAGWAVGQRPPAQWWNWIWNLIGDWILYLDDLENNVHTWTAKQTFSRAGLGDTVAAIAIDDAPAGNWGLIEAWTLDGTVYWRTYQQSGSVQYVTTYNAAYTPGGPPDWAADDAGSDAVRYVHTASGVTLQTKAAAATWAEGAWTTVTTIGSTITLASGNFVATLGAVTAGGNVSSTAGDVVAQVNVTATTGNVTATAGNVEATAGDLRGEHVVGLGATPGSAVGAGAGAGAVLTIGGSDMTHVLNLTGGAGGAGTPSVFGTITFTAAFTNRPAVHLTPVGATNALGLPEVSLLGGGPWTGYTWSTVAAPVNLTAYVWDVTVTG